MAPALDFPAPAFKESLRIAFICIFCFFFVFSLRHIVFPLRILLFPKPGAEKNIGFPEPSVFRSPLMGAYHETSNELGQELYRSLPDVTATLPDLSRFYENFSQFVPDVTRTCQICSRLQQILSATQPQPQPPLLTVTLGVGGKILGSLPKPDL